MSGNLKLKTLNLTNFATFQDQVIQFGDHFNAIVGETGSGKSLILDALQLILGQRAEKKIIRKNCEFSCVEAVFTTSDQEIKDYFYELGHPFEEEIVIKRIIHKSGSSKAFLNYHQCPVSMLAKAGKRFIDLVGQFENQKLFSEKYQLSLLDNFANNNNLIDSFNTGYEKYLEQTQQLEQLKQQESQTHQRLDYLNFQLEELEKLSPELSEEIQLKEKKDKFLELESNKKLLAEINYYFEGGDSFPGLQSVLGKLEKALGQARVLNSDIIEKFQTARDDLFEINFLLNKDLDFELSEDELTEIVDRLDLYTKLQRKYNTDTSGLIEQMNSFQSEKESLENIESNLLKLEKDVEASLKSLHVVASKLHEKRVEASKRLSKLLTKAVRELKMDGASFDISLSIGELSSTGISKISLNAEINPGEGYHRVKDIASGGELSRILLALRQVLSSRDSVSIFLFDEIDTGMGGETAFHIGKSLSKVSEHSQVIAITHLPQIATFCDKLLEVKKKVKQDKGESRTVSQVNEITGEEIKTHVNEMTPLLD
ncbi:MAG: AAA family ATPase [Bacteriovoracaceae bacterium]|nr:AAA family ATPase [Bacteriovoracaceae bacterium]